MISPIAVDAMGGDHGPTVVVEGALNAYRELGISSILVGDEKQIKSILLSLDFPNIAQIGQPGISIQNADEVITMEDSPSAAIRGKTKSSIRIAFELVKDGKASAVVSPGNTGAVMAAGLFVSGTLGGIARPAIATLIPRVGDKPPTVLLDSGANTDCSATQLAQFAMMGMLYAKAINIYEHPRVGILSNGTESSKGNDITRAAYSILSEMPQINFVGYVEGRSICKDVADVVICDGFIGNVALKTMEGAVELVLDSLKYYTSRSFFRWRLGMLLAKPMFKMLFKEKLDPSSHGGAPLLGLRSITIICHGSSKARAIKNAIKVAKRAVDANLVEKMGKALSEMEHTGGDVDDNLFDRIGKRFDKKKGSNHGK